MHSERKKTPPLEKFAGYYNFSHASCTAAHG